MGVTYVEDHYEGYISESENFIVIKGNCAMQVGTKLQEKAEKLRKEGIILKKAYGHPKSVTFFLFLRKKNLPEVVFNFILFFVCLIVKRSF